MNRGREPSHKEVDHEAHVSTQQATKKEDARIHGPHAVGRREKGPVPPPGEGSQANRGVNPGRSGRRFSPEDRIRRRAEFLRIYESGKRVHDRRFVLFYLHGAAGQHRIGLTVPGRVGGSVVRNRVKRRLRDIFRLNREALGVAPLDLVLNVSSVGARASREDLEASFLRAAAAARRGKGRPPNPDRPRRRR